MTNIALGIIVFCFFSSFILFKIAAGTLNPGKMNIISWTYFLFILQTFIGTSLIVLGFDKHYTLSYLIEREKTITITFIVVMFTAILFPTMIIFFQKMMRINACKDYKIYLKKEIEQPRTNNIFNIFLLGTIICSVLFFLFILKIGYIPLMKLVTASSDFNFAVERERISSLYIISPYVSNIFILTILPLLSYASYAYALVSKSKKWLVLCSYMGIVGIIVKTYKFEKSPLIFHILVYLLIYIYYKGGVKQIYVGVFGGGMAALLCVTYFLTGFQGTILDIYNGPLGRTLFTQVGTLMYAFDLFPGTFSFLGGRSLSPSILRLLGKDPTEHIRSARLIMEYYGSEKVYDGGAGVMNTFFVGEAYSNFGIPGVVFSIVWVSFVIAFIFCIVLKCKKTPIMISYLAIMTVKIGSVSQGGFFDFIYSFDLIFTSIIFLGIYFLFEKDGVFQKKIENIFKGINLKKWKKLKN